MRRTVPGRIEDVQPLTLPSDLTVSHLSVGSVLSALSISHLSVGSVPTALSRVISLPGRLSSDPVLISRTFITEGLLEPPIKTYYPQVWGSFYKAKKPTTSKLLAFLRKGSQGGPAAYWKSLEGLLRALPDGVLLWDMDSSRDQKSLQRLAANWQKSLLCKALPKLVIPPKSRAQLLRQSLPKFAIPSRLAASVEVFTCFSRLAHELRNKIWMFAAMDCGRGIRLGKVRQFHEENDEEHR